MPRNYECHVTCLPQDRDIIEPIADKHKFKTSVLTGDEILGDEKYLYCTKHDGDYMNLYYAMEALIKDLSEVKIVRKKIELILLDERYE